VLHVLATEGFRKYSAVAQHTFGYLLSVSFLKAGVIKKLIQLSKSVLAIDLYAPRAVEYTKVIGGAGKMRLSFAFSKLELAAFSGGAVRFVVDSIQGDEKKPVHFVEVSKTSRGTFVTLHSLRNDGTTEFDNKITRCLILKAFASDVLKKVWNGKDLGDVLKKRMDGTIKNSISHTSLEKVGEKLQRDIVRLYFVLNSNGICDVDKRLVRIGKAWVCYLAPFVFVYGEESEWEFPGNEVLFEHRKVTDLDAFRLLLEQNGFELPSELSSSE
jgi:hypothetical protein